jgi:aspartokinase-like uncharacterized kinase
MVLAGGGGAADFVRGLDRTFGLGNDRSHQLALRSLDLTAHALAALLPALVVVEDLDATGPAWEGRRVPILAPRRFLDEDAARSPDPLPASWDVTSDAIAARLAERAGADELVLLKSAPLPAGCDRREASRRGLVDPMFPEIARGLDRVLYLNCREVPRVPMLLCR